MSLNTWNEKWLSLLAIAWGVILILPGNLFSGLAAYRLAAQYAPDTLWGVVLGISGLLLLLPVSVSVHKYAHWVLCTVWLGLFVLAVSNFQLPFVMLASQCLIISMFHAGIFWRISRSSVLCL